jgi:hypothetical protein
LAGDEVDVAVGSAASLVVRAHFLEGRLSAGHASRWEAEAGKTTSNPFYFSVRGAGGRKADLQLFAPTRCLRAMCSPVTSHEASSTSMLLPDPVTVMIFDPLLQEAARTRNWNNYAQTSDPCTLGVQGSRHSLLDGDWGRLIKF